MNKHQQVTHGCSSIEIRWTIQRETQARIKLGT